MTEDEARAKLCPVSFAAHVPVKCKGSDCLAWRVVQRVGGYSAAKPAHLPIRGYARHEPEAKPSPAGTVLLVATEDHGDCIAMAGFGR